MKKATDVHQRKLQTPLYRTLKMVIDFTSPLALVDPSSTDFLPGKLPVSARYCTVYP